MTNISDLDLYELPGEVFDIDINVNERRAIMDVQTEENNITEVKKTIPVISAMLRGAKNFCAMYAKAAEHAYPQIDSNDENAKRFSALITTCGMLH